MASEGKQGLVVDTDTFVLRRNRVLVQNTPKAVLVMGFGPRADLLRRFAFDEASDNEDDPFIARCRDMASAAESGEFAKTRQSGIPRSALKTKDPMLRRLAIAEALAKAGFNPDEPRDERGRWTREGGGNEDDPPVTEGRSVATAVAGASAADDFASSLASRGLWALGGQLGRQALMGLALIAERFSAPTTFLGTIFIPSNSDLQRYGTIPDRPDIAFDYDEDTGVLKLSRDGDVFFSGQNQRGIFRDEQGRTFGRYVGGNIVLDPDALPITAEQAHQDTVLRSDAPPLPETDADRNEPKLCPDPDFEPSSRGFSDESLLYQWQITDLPLGTAVEFNGVKFDGCRESDGTLLEAKNRYLRFMIGSPSKRRIWDNKIEPRTMSQAENQSIAAGLAGRRVEWYFAEKPVADYFRRKFRQARFNNITVFYEPYIIEIIYP